MHESFIRAFVAILLFSCISPINCQVWFGDSLLQIEIVVINHHADFLSGLPALRGRLAYQL